MGYDVSLTLRDSGYVLTIIDDRKCPSNPPNDIELIFTNFEDFDRLLEAVKDADIIFNFHEHSGVLESMRSPEKAYHANTTIPYLLYRLIPKSRTERIIHASSAAVYGEAEAIPINENHPTKPINWYGATKLAGEILVNNILIERRVDVVILRFFNVYGPGEWLRENPGVIHNFIINALTGEPLRIEGDGTQVRDFIHVVDAVRASITAMKLEPGIYNVGSGRGVSIIDLAKLIARIHEGEIDVILAAKRFNDISRSIADITRISRASGWKPEIPLEYGVKHLYGIYRNKLASLH
ncbi:MAG: NAD-dependent epimerase/dehydratase family protein [Desulfurococcales archaeon]|nr:NAD-dependent epimerase/dehydratase family protein [Desulfurococcales archaeon]